MGTRRNDGGGVVVYRLFLSHSSPSDEAKQRLRDLAAAIEGAAPAGKPIRVLFDGGQIVGGDDWRKRIAFMLHACHGAAVLLDEAALKSKWVLAEATVVSLRHTYDETFVCVPVSFIGEQDFDQRKRARARENAALADTDWSVADLRAVQFVSGQDIGTVANGIVGALGAKGLLEGDTPVDRLANQLQLPLAGVSNEQLQALAEAVQDCRDYLKPGDGHCAGVALVRRMLSATKLMSVREVLDDLGPSYPVDDLLTILEALWPLALPAEASEQLRRRRQNGGYAHASICCEHASYLVPLYLKRAHLSRRPPMHFAIENIHGTFEELRSNVRDGWRSKLPSIRSLTDEEVDERLGSGGKDVYVSVPGPVDSEVMEQLDNAYPRVGFIVHHSHGFEPAVLPPNILPISPALTKTEEDDILADYEDAIAL
jgi:hypothetical protein